ncbi:theronine dehydrogenase-like Zn-dependent dehydrogenase [Terriglobus roseus DSM 18391]|uniref:Theronine dehydrogenase-like Zn-dependent dehydrogenase n=1 Tax=Terriglobus roseus (strain DSM 18391 / NRRL B-41598 / KBS 63) TaxID=926566 RepID=I3ZIT6_TERRK|nr:zinc-binding alcohol dehydrogenase family protein [Terriglobus roseus]AFL89154.1 theronine dehydrogenase-like Zn-dependent dehydrogenase [Terriglobus roseus DSM 18391]
MKAVALVASGDARVVDIAEPQGAPGDVLLKVEMIGLCGTDLNSYRGRNPLVTYPRVIGHEIAATVLRGTPTCPEGTHVTVSPYTSCGQCASCRRGRYNACQNNQTFGVQRDGALTELLSVPESRLYPSTLPLRALSLVEPLTVGVHAVARGRVTSSDTVAVFGCGGVGLGAIAGAAGRGARTVAIDVDDAKLETARLAGATDLIHSGREDFRARLRELNEGRGPDVIIEAIGLPETFRAAVEEVAFTGRVVYIGYAKEPVAYETKLFVQKELDILGSRNAQPEDFREVISLLESGKFPTEKAISAVITMEDVPRMLAEWSNAPAGITKILVQVSA